MVIDPASGFEQLSESQRYDFLVNQLILHKINSLKPNMISPKCYNIFHKNFFFIKDKNDNDNDNNKGSYYFFNLIDFRKNVVSFTDSEATFYSFCIIENTSILKVDKTKTTFVIQLNIVNYRWDNKIIPGQADFVYFSYNEHIFISNYLNKFIDTHQLVLILEIKKTLQLLNQIIDFDKYEF